MRYESIEQLPFVCQYNLPEAAQQVYMDAFNRAWSESANELDAREQAFAAVHARFEKDAETQSWVAKRPTEVRRLELRSIAAEPAAVLQTASA